jgi:hypothetical protein
MCQWLSYKKKIWIFFASSKSLKKAVGYGVEFGSNIWRYGSEDTDPHQKVTDPQH